MGRARWGKASQPAASAPATPADAVPPTAQADALDTPATNLLMADIVMRVGTNMLRKFVEKAFLSGRYGRKKAREIVRQRSRSGKLASAAAARIANGSWPGLVLVGSGIVVRLLYLRGKARADRAAANPHPASRET